MKKLNRHKNKKGGNIRMFCLDFHVSLFYHLAMELNLNIKSWYYIFQISLPAKHSLTLKIKRWFLGDYLPCSKGCWCYIIAFLLDSIVKKTLLIHSLEFKFFTFRFRSRLLQYRENISATFLLNFAPVSGICC